MTVKNPDSINDMISNVLRYGVLISAFIILLGTVLLFAETGSSEVSAFLTYNPGSIPHGTFDVSLNGIVSGLTVLNPFAVVQLGALVLLATPVARVAFSVLVFAESRDRTYVYITSVVLLLLLFSIFATPYIPLFNS